MRDRILSAATGLTLLLASAGSLAAETRPPANPHGDYVADCSLCHSAEAWTPARIGKGFDHSKFHFRLDGAHAAASCRSCHATLEFKKVTSTCSGCHADVHRGELGLDCARCHTTRSFVDRADEVRSHRTTRFPLTGAHVTVDCESCHPGSQEGGRVWTNRPLECQACHLPLYQTAKNPDHVASGFSTSCEECHSTVSWSPSNFNHAAAGFPLQGVHKTLACTSCHIGGKFGGIPADCYSCHQPQFDATSNPPHGAAGFSHQCQDCHRSTGWSPAHFDHTASGFPLTGMHKTLACNACHGDGVYAGKDTACYSCHKSAYDTTTDPAHAASGFPTNCESCHNTTSWQGAKFNHAASGFPLTGAHKTLACSACHGDGVYAGKDTACYSCHKTAYDSTTDPAHAGAGFPTTCETCHNTTSWQGAKFDHDTQNFPIYSGRHAGLWTSCSDCHTNPNNYMIFTCLSCHPHSDQAGTNSHHSGVSGYSYDSVACYHCHPRGRAGD